MIDFRYSFDIPAAVVSHLSFASSAVRFTSPSRMLIVPGCLDSCSLIWCQVTSGFPSSFCVWWTMVKSSESISPKRPYFTVAVTKAESMHETKSNCVS